MKRVEHIKELLDKYFEGSTSHAEELELRRFFAEAKHLPEEMAAYKPLFSYIDEESGTTQVVHHSRRLHLTYIWSAAAASILLLLGIAGYNGYAGRHADYVIINGEKSTDIRLAKEQARKAFADVSFSKEDIADDLVPQDMKEIVE
jgi:hypothetical protein